MRGDKEDGVETSRVGPIVVNNRIAECDDGKSRRLSLANLTQTAVHRISFAGDDGGGHFDDVAPIPDERLDGPAMAARFHDRRRVSKFKRHWADRPGSYTAGQTPYALLLLADGEVDQCLAISDYGPHARRWSSACISLAAVGDFRGHAPTPAQWETAVSLCALLHSWGAPPVGHTELPRSSSDPSKQCPGRMWPMGSFRVEVAAHHYARLSRFAAEETLKALGVVF